MTDPLVPGGYAQWTCDAWIRSSLDIESLTFEAIGFVSGPEGDEVQLRLADGADGADGHVRSTWAVRFSGVSLVRWRISSEGNDATTFSETIVHSLLDDGIHLLELASGFVLIRSQTGEVERIAASFPANSRP